jgi:hypothetical protein
MDGHRETQLPSPFGANTRPPAHDRLWANTRQVHRGPKDKDLGGKRAVLVGHLDQSGLHRKLLGTSIVDLAQKAEATLG